MGYQSCLVSLFLVLKGRRWMMVGNKQVAAHDQIISNLVRGGDYNRANRKNTFCFLWDGS
jgi:hypothetical protein